MKTDALSQLKLNAEYSTGPFATTDLHAGGNLFCVIYEEVLTFSEGGTVNLEFRILDNWRPLANEAAELLESNATGKYFINGKGYIKIEFPRFHMTGLPTDSNPNWLVFHLFRNESKMSGNRIYLLRQD